MKFSYSLIKKLVPRLPAKSKLVAGLNMKAFETELSAGDTFEVKLPPNRYSDAASHWGIAREAAAIFNLKAKIDDRRIVNLPENRGLLRIKVRSEQKCPRYLGRLFELKKIAPSPAFIRQVLHSCGLRPINGVVDIMNYVMLETGQPLHAFDAAELVGEIIVRSAKEGEEFISLDGVKYRLTKDDLVVADRRGPLAIAGVKGGQRAGVNQRTKRIVVEAANFDQVSIYRTMKRLSLVTDAALRFSHGLNPRLAQWGMDRATVLLRQILGVKLLDSLALGNEPSEKKVIEFNVAKFNKLIGSQFSEKLIVSYLTRLGFAVRDLPQENLLLVEPPRWRDDIDIFEDVAEEVIRLYGLDELQSRPPVVSLQPPEIQAEVTLKDKVREILMNFGFSEVYNYSLTGEKGENCLELENPVSLDRRYLRTNLLSGLKANLRNNAKDFETIRIFEIGKIWNKEGERLHLGLALKETSAWLTLKGILNRLLTGIGLTDVLMRPAESKRLLIESYHHVLGFLEAVSQSEALAEIDLSRLTQLALEENEYQPLPKYPAIVRDISLVVSASLMVGEIITFINDLSLKNVVDIDLIDYLENFGGDSRKKSLTFRIVFRSSVRTLTDEEVNQELAKLQTALVKNFQAVIR